MKNNPFGKEGDFITSPMISNLFGEMLAIWCVAFWEHIGKPSKILLVELGPGDGSLSKSLLKTFKQKDMVQQVVKDIFLLPVKKNTTKSEIN